MVQSFQIRCVREKAFGLYSVSPDDLVPRQKQMKIRDLITERFPADQTTVHQGVCGDQKLRLVEQGLRRAPTPQYVVFGRNEQILKWPAWPESLPLYSDGTQSRVQGEPRC